MRDSSEPSSGSLHGSKVSAVRRPGAEGVTLQFRQMQGEGLPAVRTDRVRTPFCRRAGEGVDFHSVHGGGGVTSQHSLQVISQHALQQVSRGVVSQHALQVSRPTTRGEVQGVLQAHTHGGSWGGSGQGGLQAHTWGRGVSRPTPGGSIPACTEADPPNSYGCGRYASYWNAFLFLHFLPS